MRNTEITNGILRSTVTALLLGFGVLAVFLALRGDGERPSPSNEPATPSLSGISCLEPTEAYVFDSLDEMTATVDLVAVGMVTQTKVGKVIPDPAGSAGPSYPDPWNTTRNDTVAPPPLPPEEPEDDTVELYPTRFFDTAVRTEEVLKGEALATEVTVETLETAYCPPTDWREPGTRVLLFLARGEEAQRVYVPKNITQSAYIVRGGDLVAAREDRFVPLVKRVAKLSLPELIREVEEAKAKIESGEVTALPEVR